MRKNNVGRYKSEKEEETNSEVYKEQLAFKVSKKLIQLLLYDDTGTT